MSRPETRRHHRLGRSPFRAGWLGRLVTYPVRLGSVARPGPPPFVRLAVVHACSSAGDALVTVALAGSLFVSLSLNAARGRTALGLVCTILPFLVVGPYLGPLVDRVRGGRRMMVSAASVGRAVACVGMAFTVHSLWLFPWAFLSLVGSKTYLVAKASLVPGAVRGDEDLVEANAKLAVGSSIVTSVAALVGAGVYQLLGSRAVLRLDVLVFVAAAVGAARLCSADRAVPGAPTSPAPATGRPLPHGGVALAAVTMLSMRAMAGLMTALVIFGFRRQGVSLVWYGLVGVGSVTGNLGGAALAPVLRRVCREEWLVPGSAVVIAAAAYLLAGFSVVHYRPAALILGIVVGLGASVAKLAFDALVQRDAPARARSRRFAQFETLFQLGWVAAALVPVLIPLSLLIGFVIVGCATLAGGVVFVLGLDRARRGTLPGWWPDARPEPVPAPPGAGWGGAGARPDVAMTSPVGTVGWPEPILSEHAGRPSDPAGGRIEPHRQPGT